MSAPCVPARAGAELRSDALVVFGVTGDLVRFASRDTVGRTWP